MTAEALRVAVAEDEVLNRDRLVRLLRNAGCEVMASFEEGDALLAWLEEGHCPDAIFLDIQMPGPDGLEILERMPEPIPVVFVTAHSEYAVEAFDSAAVDYLLKPVRSERLSRALARIRKTQARNPAPPGLGARSARRFPAKAGGGMVLLDLGKTTHFEVREEVVWAHAGNQAYQTNWSTIASVVERFPDVAFLRIHRHLLVRQDAIVGVRTTRGGRLLVLLPGGVELESSRPAAPRIRAMLGLKEG